MNEMELIKAGKTALGIEFGSTRIKAVLTDLNGQVLAVGFHDWENSLVNGIWTYSLDEIHAGLKSCYASMKAQVTEKYGVDLTTVGALGISAMMHGYLAFDKDGNLLAPFQTWRNSNTQASADTLTDLFGFNIPLRWTIAHLYQRILDGEEHVKNIAFVTTLDSYIHWKLTGEKVTGIGDAAGIFPIDSSKLDYDQKMVDQFDTLISDRDLPWKLRDVLPKVLCAGEAAGVLTDEGAAFLDESGSLKGGILMCPPEGDAGTGMVATNAVAPGTGNVSAGTSTFAMLVLDRPLSKLYREIDMVTTPTGFPVAMSHANNGTSDLNAWVNLFAEFAALSGNSMDMGDIFKLLYENSLKGDKDCGGVLSYGYYSGEGITGLAEGRPLLVRTPDSTFSLANLMRSHLYTSLGAVKMGLDILLKDEKMNCVSLTGHGGFFKTKGVGQRYLAAAAGAPVTVMETASEGGPWGMALLAAFALLKNNAEVANEFASKAGSVPAKMEDYLTGIFAEMEGSTLAPDPADIEGFEKFMESYKAGLDIERAAIAAIK